MKKSTLLVVGVGMYLFFVVCLILSLVYLEGGSNMQMMAMTSISSTLTLFTIILAVFYMRGSNKERYEELYMKDKEEGKEN